MHASIERRPLNSGDILSKYVVYPIHAYMDTYLSNKFVVFRFGAPPYQFYHCHQADNGILSS